MAILQGTKIILKSYELNIILSKYIKQNRETLKEAIDETTVIVKNSNKPLSILNRQSSKESVTV